MTLLRMLGRAARRTGEYLFGIVFGTKAERTYGNNHHLRHGAGATSTEEFQAHQRAVSSSIIGGGAL